MGHPPSNSRGSTILARDSQIIEVRGRHRLIEELIRAGLEVAVPFRDRGVDLIAYSERGGAFCACPIQLKAATGTSFGIDRKYSSAAGLLLVHLWHLSEPGNEEFFATTYTECLEIAEALGWTRTRSWKSGRYVVTRVGGRLTELLQPYRMTPEKWTARVAAVSQEI